MTRHPFLFAAAAAAAIALSGCADLAHRTGSPVYQVFPAESVGVKAAHFDAGYALEHGIGVPRDYAAAVAAYKAASAAGDARADNNLGVMALQGRGSNVNPSAAFAHFRRGAERGSATARYNLGLMKDMGIGRAADAVSAAHDYRIAAEQGNAFAQYRLAQMYEIGHGVTPSAEEARRLYEMAAVRGHRLALGQLDVLKGHRGGVGVEVVARLLAAEHCGACETSSEKAMASRGISELRRLADLGDAPARDNLAVRLLKGEGSNADPSEAARLFTLAAEQGYAPAQRQLAQMHLRGQAVAKSKVLAHAWLNLASRAYGEEGAAARREMEGLEVTMTVAEVREAQRIAAGRASYGR